MSTAIFSAAGAVRLPDAGLQHEQLAALDGELDVLHVAVVPLEPLEHVDSSAKECGSASSIGWPSEPLPSAMPRVKGCGVRMPATTSSPWALIRNSP